MSPLFVSFYYIGTEKYNNQCIDHKEFDNMVIDEPLPYELEEETFVEWLTTKSNDYTREHLGMNGGCSCTILFWKKLDE